MPAKLAILVWSVDATQPDLAAAPFVYARAAAAMDCQVEMHFAAAAVRLLLRGVAAQALTAGGKPLLAYLREAAELGVEFFACAQAAQQQGIQPEHIAQGDAAAMVEEFSGFAAASTFVRRTLDPTWRTLVF